MGIGKNIRTFRILANMTQEELAEKMGYKSKTTINKIEKEVNSMPIERVRKFAEVLGTSPSVLLGEEDSVRYVLQQQMDRTDDRSPTLIELQTIAETMNEAGLLRLLAYAKDIEDKYRKGDEDATPEKKV